MHEPKSLLSSVRSAIRIIGLFTAETPVLGVSEIARRLQVAKSTASRLSTTLCAENILTPTSNRQYRLNVRLASVGLLAAQSHPVYEAGREALVRIRAATCLSAHLSIIDGTELAPICRLTSDEMDQRPHHPVLTTCAGKAILAFSEPDLVERCLEMRVQRYTPTTVIKVDELRTALQTVRQSGYALARGDYIPDLGGVAVPILDHSGMAVAALTVFGRVHHLPERTIAQTASLLRKSAQAITAAIY
jgi:IclR family transcriptional regulator, KDG regulon repressor